MRMIEKIVEFLVEIFFWIRDPFVILFEEDYAFNPNDWRC